MRCRRYRLRDYVYLLIQNQANVQFYNNLLTSTGGKLALHKSYAYILDTEWKHGTRRYRNTHQSLPPLSINQNGTQQEMHLLPPSTARKMLGVYTAPDGNSKDQAMILRKKSEAWSTSIKKKSLYQYKILLSYHHAIMKTLEYPLRASLLTKF